MSKTLIVKVRPGAKKTQIKGTMADGTIKIDVAAKPEDGKANAELIRFLTEEFDVPKSGITIVSGQASHQKRIRLDGQ